MHRLEFEDHVGRTLGGPAPGRRSASAYEPPGVASRRPSQERCLDGFLCPEPIRPSSCSTIGRRVHQAQGAPISPAPSYFPSSRAGRLWARPRQLHGAPPSRNTLSLVIIARTMDQAELMSRTIECAEEHVLVGERLITHQKELIHQMLKLGAEVSGYREALARFEQNQTLRVQRMQRHAACGDRKRACRDLHRAVEPTERRAVESFRPGPRP